MNVIKVANTKFVNILEVMNIKSEEVLMIDMSDKFIVHKNDIGQSIMIECEVISYAKNLVEANPEIWSVNSDGISLHDGININDAIHIIHNTLDNESVINFENKNPITT